MLQRPGIRHPPWTPWDDVHIGWKRFFYRLAMERAVMRKEQEVT